MASVILTGKQTVVSLRGITEMSIIIEHLLGTEPYGVTRSSLQTGFHRPGHCGVNGLGVFLRNLVDDSLYD